MMVWWWRIAAGWWKPCWLSVCGSKDLKFGLIRPELWFPRVSCPSLCLLAETNLFIFQGSGGGTLRGISVGSTLRCCWFVIPEAGGGKMNWSPAAKEALVLPFLGQSSREPVSSEHLRVGRKVCTDFWLLGCVCVCVCFHSHSLK